MTDSIYSKEFLKLSERLAKDLIDRGLLIRAGAKVLLTLQLPADREEALRYAFYAGAEHLFTSIMGALDEGPEVTPADERRVTLINAELEKWRKTAFAVLESSSKGHA